MAPRTSQFYCDNCRKWLPTKNRRRHSQSCRNITLSCSCGAVLRTVTKKHLRSRRHRESPAQQAPPQQVQQQDTPNAAPRELHAGYALSLQLALDTLESHEHDPSHPISAIYSAWKDCLKISGLQDMAPGRNPSKYWRDIGLQPPSIFPAHESWLHEPIDDDEVLDNLLHNYNNRKSMTFVRGEPSRPVSGALPKVLRQLKTPDERQTFSAFNIRSDVLSMRIPETISARYPPDNAENIVEVNITPRGAVVDLHFDPLSHGITGCTSGCIKLWGTWPPSDHNVQALLDLGPSNNRFIELYHLLEGGEFGITKSDSAMYIPPLCLHATLTLRGGFTPGIQFSSAACLVVAAKAWELESVFHPDQLHDFYSQVYKALEVALRPYDPRLKLLATRVFCEMKGELRSDKRKFQNLKVGFRRLHAGGCPICSQTWNCH